MEDKKYLRKKFSELRKNITDKNVKDSLITARFLEQKFLYEADTVLLYASFGSEVDTWALADELLSRSIAAAFPKCRKTGEMTFHIVSSLSDLKSGMYGIKEPEPSLPQPEITDKTICIIPGLAFTSFGGRLGYGGGYYDRFLSVCPQVKKAAFSYEELITEDLPLMPHDLNVDYIVTEERMVLCNAE